MTQPHDQLIHALGRRARAAASELAHSTVGQRNAGLQAAAGLIREREGELLAANQADLSAAEARGLSTAMIDRLRLDPGRLDAMADGLEAMPSWPTRWSVSWPTGPAPMACASSASRFRSG